MYVSQDSRALLASGDKRMAAAREELEGAVDRIQAANASLAEAKENEAEVCVCVCVHMCVCVMYLCVRWSSVGLSTCRQGLSPVFR
jgi:hypothetical protein